MNSTPPFPSYRDRYLPAMSLAQIEALTDKAWAPVIIATGAIEQHGLHLPVAVDALMGQVWLERLLPLLDTTTSCYVAPPITIGKSNEHTGFPGTLFISKDTLRALLLTIARQLHTWGFRHIAILNTHGGNTDVILYTLHEIRAELGLGAAMLRSGIDLNLPLREQTLGMHANTAETAWLQAVAPQYVSMDDAVCEYPDPAASAGQLRPEAAPATFAWVTADVSRSGVMGDAPAGTADRGEVWLAAMAAGYARAIDHMAAQARTTPAGSA
ncbi:creatininase family protein [Synoicihabitans lomoniglobus]|uniref:Creatininase family protein n=1 Tax=Synoicihabitans lomoniglobus TaxID=2909285 RepID=A0AAF0CRA2_9BACT|nr:creatininase family protein [Opitutaceae bacterium LMO-M01]WED66632.1 creatininase family protein [Opitutaceae bacterium LMO-M01]